MEFRLEAFSPDGSEGHLPEGTRLEDLPTKFCAAPECKNGKDLKKCSRCKSAMYCSSACQKRDWPNHKAQCLLNVTQAASFGGFDNEPPLQRHLRHFTARFEGSLTCAAIVALGICHDFANAGRKALVIALTPRAHEHPGARFLVRSVTVMTMTQLETFMHILEPAGGAATLAQHQLERAKIRERHSGAKDFTAALLYATGGEWEGTAMRFKPICVDRAMAASPAFRDETLDWETTLRIQVERDMPARAT